MSNEEVVLAMVINRLKLLLESHEDLRSKWSAEITEIILLGEGVLSPETQLQTPEGLWILAVTREEADDLYEIVYRTHEASTNSVVRSLLDKVDRLTDSIAIYNDSVLEPNLDEEPDQEVDGMGVPQAHVGVDFAAPAHHDILWRPYEINVPENAHAQAEQVVMDDAMLARLRAALNNEPVPAPEVPNEQG